MATHSHGKLLFLRPVLKLVLGFNVDCILGMYYMCWIMFLEGYTSSYKDVEHSSNHTSNHSK